LQELGQADISVLLKAELKDRLATLRKALDKQIKEKENAINKAVWRFACCCCMSTDAFAGCEFSGHLL
jgi:hypothetical protein